MNLITLKICDLCRSCLADESQQGKPVQLYHVVCQRNLTHRLRVIATQFGYAMEVRGFPEEKVDGGALLELTKWQKERERKFIEEHNR